MGRRDVGERDSADGSALPEDERSLGEGRLSYSPAAVRGDDGDSERGESESKRAN